MAASVTLLVSVLMLSSVRVGKSAEALFNLTCQPEVYGAIGETTNIYCSIESETGPVVINTVVLTRIGENHSCFTFTPHENRVTGDPRFTVESSPSLQLHNTVMSDEGGYTYYIRTDQGSVNATFTIIVYEMISCSFSSRNSRVVPDVVIIACLIVGLLIFVLFKIREFHKIKKAKSMDLPYFAKNPADVEEH